MPAPTESPLKAEIRGLEETQKKMDQVVTDLHGKDFLDAMREATLIVTREARILAPVDQGPLRSSITPEVRTNGTETEGVVGSNLKQAPYMELGTGIYAGNPRVKMPPASALEGWASRHGTTGAAVAWAIFKAGGLKPRRYLQGALEKNTQRIFDLLGDAVGRIVQK